MFDYKRDRKRSERRETMDCSSAKDLLSPIMTIALTRKERLCLASCTGTETGGTETWCFAGTGLAEIRNMSRAQKRLALA